MKSTIVALSLCALQAVALVQNPCAGCTEEFALKYQVCVKDFGDACMEMTKKEVFKLDYLGQKICKGKKEDGKCPKFDENSGKECPDDYADQEKDWHTGEPWACAEEYEKETVTVTAGGQATKKDVSCCMTQNKHANCLKCKAMDCSHGTCDAFVNQKYYSERTMEDTGRDASGKLPGEP